MTIINERDKMLQDASIRVEFSRTGETRSKSVNLTASTQFFFVDENGNPYPPSIGIACNRDNIKTAAAWSVTEGSANLAISGSGAVLNFADMTSDRVTIRTTVNETDGTLPADIKPVGQENTPWLLSFNDEFPGDAIAIAKWNLKAFGDADATQENYKVAGSNLLVFPTAAYEKRAFTTHGKFAQVGGYFEMRAQLPIGKGLIPKLWLYHHDHATDRPRFDILRAFPGGTATSTETSTGTENGTIGIEYYADQGAFVSGTTGTTASKAQWIWTDENLDAAYVVAMNGVWWNSTYRLLFGVNTTAFETSMASSTARVVIIQVGWADVYEGILLADSYNNMAALIDFARSRGKYVIVETFHETDDGSWAAHRGMVVQAANDKGVPVIDQYGYTRNYRISAGLGIYDLCPDGKYPNTAHHERKGKYAATRIKEIMASDASFPRPGVTTTTPVSGGGGWGTSDFRPIDYEGVRTYGTTSISAETRTRLSQSYSGAPDLSAAFNYYGVRIDSDGWQFFYNGAPLGAKQTATNLQNLALYIGLSLEYETASTLAPNATDTPTGEANAFKIDYVRAWSLDPNAGAAPPPIQGESGSVRPVGHSGKTWPLVFADDFNSTMLNASAWVDTLAPLDFSPSEANIDVNAGGNSMLRMWPALDAAGGNKPRYITSRGKKEWTYGYFEVRAKLPRGMGVFPSFFMYNKGHNPPPEVDFMNAFQGIDSLGSIFEPMYYSVTDWGRSPGSLWTRDSMTALGKINLNMQHTYGLLWAANRLEFYFNGVLWATRYTSEQNASMYMNLFLDYGGYYGIGVDNVQLPRGNTNSLEIDYVRVWSFDGQTV